MKSLVDCLNESLNEGLLTPALLTLLLPTICLVETVYHSFKNPEYNADHSLKGLVSHDGIVMGFIEWLFERFGEFGELLKDKRIRREMDKIKESEEFKEYLRLPKSKRTLKKLREIGKLVNTKDSWAVLQIWDEFKKGRHISDEDLKNEMK
jgi:hypothetical protein